jgi:release factor glutamine methyltransferase
VLYPSKRRIRQYADHVAFGKRVLDVGTGTGVLARLALERGAEKVVAADINPAAVAWARRAVPDAEVVLSDLFGAVSGEFDTILFAAPWSEGEIREDVHHAVFDRGVVARFLKEAPAHLAPGGAIWLQYCDASARNFAALQRTLSELNYSVAGTWRYRDYDLFARKRCHIYLYKLLPSARVSI